MASKIQRGNVGRIAERIVANELEYRGYRVSDLNKEGLSANADLIATNTGNRWAFQYGHCTDGIIDQDEPMFNRRKSFYKADIVVLVAVASPTKYWCIALPVKKAEQAAQLNIARGYRTPTKLGKKKKAHKVWIHPTASLNEHSKDPWTMDQIKREREILNAYGDWEVLRSSRVASR